MLTSPKLGASAAEGSALAVAFTLGWGPLASLGRWAGRGERLAQEMPLALIPILPVLPSLPGAQRGQTRWGSAPTLRCCV